MVGLTGARRIGRVSTAVLLAASLSGCGTMAMFGETSSSEPASASVQTADAGAAPSKPVKVDIDVAMDCPQVRVATGGSSVANPPGSGGTPDVRYQISITELARECVLEPGNQVLIKIGVRGVVAIGPKGGPGAFSAPLRITVVDRGGAVIVTQDQKVGATVGADGAPARYQLVMQDLRVPIALDKPLRGYNIFVSLNSKS
jgi:hypothetical protein